MTNNTIRSSLIKNARISKGLKQKDVANLIGITPTIINRLECGETKKVSLKVASKISIILELNFFQFLELSGYKQKDIHYEAEKLYDNVSNFKNFPYLLFLLDKLSDDELETLNQFLAQTINFSDEDKELIISLYNAIPKLSSKEREIIKIILS